MQIVASQLPAQYLAAIKTKKSIESKTAQSEVADLYRIGKRHTLTCTGVIVVIPKFDSKAGKASDKEFDCFLQTVEGIKVPLNQNHESQVKSVTKETKVNFAIDFNELKAPVKKEKETAEVFKARQDLYTTLSNAASLQELDGKKGYYSLKDVTIEL